MESKYINKSLQKSFKILEILSQSVFPLKASSISRKAVMSRTTTFRLLSVLNQLGYIHKNSETNTYTMGHKAFQFGEISDYLQSISEESKDILNDISKQTGLITYLAMLEGPQIVHSDKISSNNDSGNFRTFRMRLDAHCCAIGKVILAYRPDNEISLIDKSYNFYPHTNHTIANIASLKKELNTIRKQGYSLNHAETFDNVYGANTIQKNLYDETAAPIVDAAMEGYNGTIFAYGQTGAGKTFTMEGVPDPPELRGIIPNTFRHIFQNISRI